MNDTRTLVKRTEKKAQKVYRKYPREVRVIAVFLVFAMAFSAFGANLNSIVKLLEAYAEDDYADSGNMFYPADLTLYDYYTDSELKGGSDNNAYDGVNRNKIFNMALYESGYATGQKTTDKTSAEWYWPLYLGLQFPGQGDSNPMISAGGNPYNYSIMVNSQAGTGNTSYAAQGLVDNVLYAGEISQGNGTTLLPYFDEEFLEAKLSRLMNAATLASESITNTDQSLGKVEKDMTFRFRKLKDGYYVYRSTTDPLEYDSDNKTFTTGTEDGNFVQDLSWSGHAAQNAFFPFNVKDSSYTGKFGYGARFDIPFTMSETGQATINNTAQNIKFTFSGDDDVWVFIDGHLVLDVGGAHGRVDGEVDFYTKRATVTHTKNQSDYDMQDGSAVGHVNDTTPFTDLSTLFNTLGLYSDVTREHTLTVFYLERGSLESNCEIKFNFQISDKVIIKNTIEMGDVNEKLKAATQQVIDSEGMQYIAASNSISSTGTNDTAETTNSGTLVTLSYDKGGASGKAPASKKVKSGTQVVLSKGYTLEKKGYRIKGWNTAAEQSDPNTSSPYTVNSTHTLYPVWEEIPIAPLAPPPAPTLVFISHGARITQHYVQGADEGVITENYQYLYNLTSKELQYKPMEARFTVKISAENQNERQHPRKSSSPYYFTDTDYAYLDDDAEFVKFRKNGGFMWWRFTGEYSSQVDHYDDYAGFKTYSSYGSNGLNDGGTDYSADTWVTNYYALYTYLTNQYNTYKDTTDPDIRAAYIAAVDAYKSLSYGSDPSAVSNTFNTAVAAANDKKKTFNAYTDGYYYPLDDVTFYVFTDNAGGIDNLAANNTTTVDARYACENYYNSSYTPWEIPNATSNGKTLQYVDGNHPYEYFHPDAFGDADNNGVNWIDSTTPTFSAATVEPSGSTGSYYKVRVPRYVRSTVFDTANNPATVDSATDLPNHVVVTVGSKSLELTAEELKAMGSDGYPCWYVDADMQKGVTEPLPTYDLTGRSIIWAYNGTTSNPNLKIRYVNPFTGNANDEVTVTWTQDASCPAGYWYTEVYTTVDKKLGGTSQGTSPVGIKIGDKTVSDITDTSKAYCYYTTTKYNSSDVHGWYQLYTMVAKVPSWWYTNSPINGNTNDVMFYVQAQSASADHPLHSIGWGEYPQTNTKLVKIDNDYGYYYIPEFSGVDFVLYTAVEGRSSSDPRPSWDANDNKAWRTQENFKPNVTSNVLYVFDTQDSNKYYTINNTESGTIDANNVAYWQYTAAYKSHNTTANNGLLSATATANGTLAKSAPPVPEIVPDAQDAITVPSSETKNVTLPDASATVDDTKGGWENFEPSEGTDSASAKTQTRTIDPSKASGDANDGKFINDSDTPTKKDEYSYAFVKNTGFKLYDDDRFAGANGVNYVTRFTTNDGTFNLLNGQKAVFSAKFQRGSGFKLSQTGFSYAFGDAAKYNGTSANTNGTSYNTAATANVPLYKRYKTEYSVSDGTGATDDYAGNYGQEYYFAYGSDDYLAAYYNKHKNDEGYDEKDVNGYSRDYNYYGIPLRNIDGSDPGDEGSEITISYTNTVRTGTLILSKKFSDDVKQKLIAQYDPDDAETDLTFYFTLTFSEVFGGSSGAIQYDGTYKLWDDDDESSSSYTETEKNSSNGYVDNYKIAFKLSQILNLSGNPLAEYGEEGYNPNYGNYRMHKVVIEGIPVYTKYTIVESEPDGQDSGVIFRKANVQKKSGDPKAVPASDNTFIAKLEAQINDTESTDSWDSFFDQNDLYEDENQKVYQYHRAVGDESTVSVEAFNADSTAYILLTKQIDYLYYNTQEPGNSYSTWVYNSNTGEYEQVTIDPYDDCDDPAGLAKRNVTVGGGESTDYDYNGYEDATNAEQSFIYRIEKFERDNHITPVLVYNEVISFAKPDWISNGYTLSKLLKVDSNYDYRITELTDWSWKYNRTATYVSPTLPFPEATLENSISADRKSVWVKTYTITSYTEHTCRDEPLENGSSLWHSPGQVEYWKPGDTNYMTGSKSDLDYWTEVIFYNDKVSRPKRDVEGDVSIKRNFVKYKGSLSGTSDMLAGG